MFKIVCLTKDQFDTFVTLFTNEETAVKFDVLSPELAASKGWSADEANLTLWVDFEEFTDLFAAQ